MYVVKNEGSWVLFTKSNYLLNRALLNQGLGVPRYFTCPYVFQIIHSQSYHLGAILQLLNLLDVAVICLLTSIVNFPLSRLIYICFPSSIPKEQLHFHLVELPWIHFHIPQEFLVLLGTKMSHMMNLGGIVASLVGHWIDLHNQKFIRGHP